MTDDRRDLTTEESDALSLHTIAEQADAYAAQEQEDADFALALALEDQETQRLISHSQQSEHRHDSDDSNTPESHEPYRDDPETVEQSDELIYALPPYRDDPNAEPTDDRDTVADTDDDARPAQRHCNFTRILKAIRNVWVVTAIVVSIFILAIVVGLVIVMPTKSKKSSARELAWRSSNSADGDLRLPKLYPSFEDGASEDCKATWEKYAWTLRCHRMILENALDNGDADEVKAAGADPFAYSDEICTEQCLDSINTIRNPLHNGCFRRFDRFDLLSYGKDGSAYFEEGKVDEGPLHVWRSLENRYKRFCAKPPKDTYQEKSEWGTCAADLWMRWGIADGTNEAHMKGLSTFLNATAEKKTIDGGNRTGSIRLVGGKTKSYEVKVPDRKVGPGHGETDCGYCTLDWLERKMRSFEFGQMLDPQTGEVLGLKEFSQRLHDAVVRCDGYYPAGQVLIRVHRKWEQYGWWCGREICNPDPPIPTSVRSLLHGVREQDHPLDYIREYMTGTDAPTKVLQAMHDGLKSLPCSIWFNKAASTRDVVPYQYRVHQLCSDPCRNAIDRLQKRLQDEFSAEIKKAGPVYQEFFDGWTAALHVVNQTCLNPSPMSTVRESTSFCAPGYAALGHPEWTFAEMPPSKSDILLSFSTEVDKLAASLPRYTRPIDNDEESQRILGRRFAESVCNSCAGELFMGRNPNWRDRVNDFYEDGTIDWEEYRSTVKKYFITCAKWMGHELNRKQKNEFWNYLGLDREKETKKH